MDLIPMILPFSPPACFVLPLLAANAPMSSSPKTKDPSMVATSRREDGILDGDCLARFKWGLEKEDLEATVEENFRILVADVKASALSSAIY
ncbi:hypothetical protein ACHAXS_004603 [Conticribra weissflogii]